MAGTAREVPASEFTFYNFATDADSLKPNGRLILGDAVQKMRQIKTGSIKAVITSSPYNIKNSTGNGLKNGNGGKWENAALQQGYDKYDDCLPHKEYVKWQRDCLTQMMRVLRPDGAIFYNHKWRVQNGILQDRQDIVAGFPVRQIIIWHRAGGINFNPGYFLPNYEVIYLIAKPEFKLAPKANAFGCVWRINQESSNPHPAPYPLELAKKCMQAIGEGPILDPLMGSGTTAIAAESLGFDWIGIDQSPEYLEMAKQRIASRQELG